jgi:hypothetical protein
MPPWSPLLPPPFYDPRLHRGINLHDRPGTGRRRLRRAQQPLEGARPGRRDHPPRGGVCCALKGRCGEAAPPRAPPFLGPRSGVTLAPFAPLRLESTVGARGRSSSPHLPT